MSQYLEKLRMGERIAELEKKISILLSCKNCPENKGGFICVKEYENKCLAQKIEFIKELQKENARLKEINAHTLSQLNLDNGELIIENEKLKQENAELERFIKTQDRKLRQQSKECDKAIDRVEILAKENAELRNNGFTVSAMTEQQLKVALEKGEQLEKENTELKEKLTAIRNAKDKYDMSKDKSIIKAFGVEYTLFCDLERILEDWQEDDQLTKSKRYFKNDCLLEI